MADTETRTATLAPRLAIRRPGDSAVPIRQATNRIRCKRGRCMPSRTATRPRPQLQATATGPDADWVGLGTMPVLRTCGTPFLAERTSSPAAAAGETLNPEKQ